MTHARAIAAVKLMKAAGFPKVQYCMMPDRRQGYGVSYLVPPFDGMRRLESRMANVERIVREYQEAPT